MDSSYSCMPSCLSRPIMHGDINMHRPTIRLGSEPNIIVPEGNIGSYCIRYRNWSMLYNTTVCYTGGSYTI